MNTPAGPIGWDDLEGIAFGLLGLLPDQFYELTPRQFANCVAGFHKKRTAQMEATQRLLWEATRWQTAVLLQPHAKKGRTIRPESLARFPWEKAPEDTEISREEADRITDRWIK